MKNKYFVYRISKDDKAEILSCFNSLSEAKLSVHLLQINDECFIVNGNLQRVYFHNSNGEWEYDLFTPEDLVLLKKDIKKIKDYLSEHPELLEE